MVMLHKKDSVVADEKTIKVSEFVRLVETGKKFLIVGVTAESRMAYSLLAQKNIADKLTLWVENKYNFFSLCGFPTVSCDKVPEYKFDAAVISGRRNVGFYNKIAKRYHIEYLDTYMLHDDVGADNVNNCVPWKDIKVQSKIQEKIIDVSLLPVFPDPPARLTYPKPFLIPHDPSEILLLIQLHIRHPQLL